MTIIQCTECGKDISDQAPACPNCGRPIRELAVKAAKSKSRRRLLVLAAFGFVAFAALTSTLKQNGYEPTPDKATITPDEEKDNAALVVALAGATQLKRAARNPDKFILESALIVNGTHDVCYDYRAENGFGGMNRESAVLSIKSGKLKTQEMDGFISQWNKLCADKPGKERAEFLSRRL